MPEAANGDRDRGGNNPGRDSAHEVLKIRSTRVVSSADSPEREEGKKEGRGTTPAG